MPRGDGTGPMGQGPMTGKGGRGAGGGTGRGAGRGIGAGGGGRGRMGGKGLGPAGECVCPQCGTRAPHERGIPCYEQKCPKCSTPMTRT